MKVKKGKMILSVIFSLILLIVAAMVWFFEFNSTGYRKRYRTMFSLTGITPGTEMRLPA